METRKMHDLKMKLRAVAMLNFIRSNEETHSNCRRSKQLTGRRLLDQKGSAWHVTLIIINRARYSED